MVLIDYYFVNIKNKLNQLNLKLTPKNNSFLIFDQN